MDKQSKMTIALWNANGLNQHILETKTFIDQYNIDILLVSETHFNDKSYVSIPGYKIICTNHPDNRAHGGTAIILRQNIMFNKMEEYQMDHLQATTIQINDTLGQLTISVAYCPPKHNNKTTQYANYLETLGSRFIAGGDYNAKNMMWGSRLTNTKGKALLDAIRARNCNYISTGEPTYWPSDIKKVPDLLDFFIMKSINPNVLTIESCLELSSDHSPIILRTQQPPQQNLNPPLYNHRTDWNAFTELLESYLDTKVSLKTGDEIETAIAFFNDKTIKAVSKSTPSSPTKVKNDYIPDTIKKKLKQKRKLRKKWQTTRFPDDKKKLNKLGKDIRDLLQKEKDKKLNNYLKNIDATKSSNYTLWKATKKVVGATIHLPPIKTTKGKWARTTSEKATVLAQHFKDTFENNNNDINLTYTANENKKQIKKITLTEIKQLIKTLKNNKSPGYDQISGTIMKHMPDKAIIYLRNIFNAAISLKYFPSTWKVAEVIAIPKPNKNATLATSYRPISLLPTISKIFEKILFDQINPIITSMNLIPQHQFGFRKNHSTIQQIHRVVHKINDDLNKKRVCMSIYLDVAKAFDKVWHPGLLHKLKTQLPNDFYLMLKSYIQDRKFYVKYNDACSDIQPMNAGIPQGSVLGPTLYLLYTADLPEPKSENSMIATFADDTVLMVSHKDTKVAKQNLQNELNVTLNWFKKWNIEINADKTIQVNYTNRRTTIEPVSVGNSDVHIDTKAKYLGITIDSKLNWQEHIKKKRNEVKNRFKKLYWLLGPQSNLSLQNKVLIYRTIIAPIWKYGIEIWGTAAKSNLSILQRVQSKILRTLTNAPWYIPNADIHRDLDIDTIDETIQSASRRHINRLLTHTNAMMRGLPNKEKSTLSRLNRQTPTDLAKSM